MILKELEKLLLEFELKTRKKPLSPRTGKNILVRNGRGMDFKESRTYTFGDDIRFIDWNVSSRMNELYVKIFHEETDRQINLFLDVSASMNFKASNDRTKSFIAFQIVCFLTLLSIQSGDRVNIFLYSEKILSKKINIKSKAQAYKILREIEDFTTQDITNHFAPFIYLKNIAKKNSITYILSDFANLPSLDNYKSILNLHEIYFIKIFDPIEEKFQEKILKQFYIENIETKFEGIYNSTFEEDFQKLLSINKGNILQLRTNSSLSKALVRFFA